MDKMFESWEDGLDAISKKFAETFGHDSVEDLNKLKREIDDFIDSLNKTYETYKTTTKEQEKLTKAHREYLAKLRDSGRLLDDTKGKIEKLGKVTKETAQEFAAWVYSTNSVADALQNLTRGLSANLRANEALVRKMRETASIQMQATRSFEDQVKSLNALRDELNLTRTDWEAFSDILERGVDFGYSIEQTQEFARALTGMMGKVDGLKKLQAMQSSGNKWLVEAAMRGDRSVGQRAQSQGLTTSQIKDLVSVSTKATGDNSYGTGLSDKFERLTDQIRAAIAPNNAASKALTELAKGISTGMAPLALMLIQLTRIRSIMEQQAGAGGGGGFLGKAAPFAKKVGRGAAAAAVPQLVMAGMEAGGLSNPYVNIAGNAASGGLMGFQMGGPWGAAIGATAGGAYGMYQNYSATGDIFGDKNQKTSSAGMVHAGLLDSVKADKESLLAARRPGVFDQLRASRATAKLANENLSDADRNKLMEVVVDVMKKASQVQIDSAKKMISVWEKEIAKAKKNGDTSRVRELQEEISSTKAELESQAVVAAQEKYQAMDKSRMSVNAREDAGLSGSRLSLAAMGATIEGQRGMGIESVGAAQGLEEGKRKSAKSWLGSYDSRLSAAQKALASARNPSDKQKATKDLEDLYAQKGSMQRQATSYGAVPIEDLAKGRTAMAMSAHAQQMASATFGTGAGGKAILDVLQGTEETQKLNLEQQQLQLQSMLKNGVDEKSELVKQQKLQIETTKAIYNNAGIEAMRNLSRYITSGGGIGASVAGRNTAGSLADLATFTGSSKTFVEARKQQAASSSATYNQMMQNYEKHKNTFMSSDATEEQKKTAAEEMAKIQGDMYSAAKTAAEDSLKAATAEIEVDQRRKQFTQDILQLEQQRLEMVGAAPQAILENQNKMAQNAYKMFELAKKKFEEIKKQVGPDSPEYQNAAKEMMQAQVNAQTSIMGRNKTMMDALMGGIIGIQGGTKWQPGRLSEREIWGGGGVVYGADGTAHGTGGTGIGTIGSRKNRRLESARRGQSDDGSTPLPGSAASMGVTKLEGLVDVRIKIDAPEFLTAEIIDKRIETWAKQNRPPTQ